jgi:hypothetical protein
MADAPRAGVVKDIGSTLLETLALLLFAAGLTGGLWPVVGWLALCVGALVVGVAAWLVGRPVKLDEPRE